jgi:hypothetical protein
VLPSCVSSATSSSKRSSSIRRAPATCWCACRFWFAGRPNLCVVVAKNGARGTLMDGHAAWSCPTRPASFTPTIHRKGSAR